jgi:hypothetical protein
MPASTLNRRSVALYGLYHLIKLARLSLLEGFMTREGALNGHHGQKVCTTGAMFYFCSKSFRRELMRGGGWSGSVSFSCSSKIF